jgi:transposase
MRRYVGLDVSLQKAAVCVVYADGGVVWRGECLCPPEAIAAIVRAKAPHAVRVGLEAGRLPASRCMDCAISACR